MITELEPVEVVHVPEVLEQGKLYISRKFETAIHLCACGCGEKTVTPFGSPYGWNLIDGKNGITLRPSIGNQNFPCRSHYWITNNKVENCS